MSNVYLFLTLFLIPISSFAQAGDYAAEVYGKVVDSETGEGIPYVYIHVEEIKRSATTSREGRFSISGLPPGTFTIVLHRVGYVGNSIQIFLREGEEQEVTISLKESVLSGRMVEISGSRDNLTGGNLEHASQKMSGDELRENLGMTLSETLSSKPGFFQRTMGASPARPVIRGLGDQRIIILQDGQGTGDVSYTSADHAVTIDPHGADEIEVARGPDALAYGSNAIGGVINVVRNQIPSSQPESLGGTVTSGFSSVNTGLSGSVMLLFPYKDYAVNFESNTKHGGDFRSATGTISNTGYLSNQTSLGFSKIRPWGYSGFAVSSYLNNYGIPPDPIQGHPNGVDIEMMKFGVENRNEIILGNSFIRYLDTRLAYRFYNHVEFETANVIGTEYTTNTVSGSVKANHRDFGIFENGKFGYTTEFQHYFLSDRETTQTYLLKNALYAIQDIDAGSLDIELGVRLDVDMVIPENEFTHNRIGDIRRRNFIGLSSSMALIQDLGSGFYTGAIFLHSFRPPTADELFSRGPHIAAYSFEIGNPKLDAERGLANELFFRYRSDNVSAELNGYFNYFTNYIYPRDTGSPSVPFPRLNEWRFESTTARIYGAEGQIEARLVGSLNVNASLSYTIGEREYDPEFDVNPGWQPLPMIPPLNITGGFNYQFDKLRIGARVNFSDHQKRTAQFETETEDYIVLDFHAQYRIMSSQNYYHTFTLRGNNILNQEYRDHLSRLKEVFPEPGRNIEVLYRLYF